jgi:hypothetical protein
MELPGLPPVGGRRGNRAALIRAREGADQRPAHGFAPFPVLGRERRPAHRAVDGRADHRAWDTRLMELAEGKTAITDERCVAGELLVGPLEKAELSVGCAGISCLAPDEQAGHG